MSGAGLVKAEPTIDVEGLSICILNDEVQALSSPALGRFWLVLAKASGVRTLGDEDERKSDDLADGVRGG